MSFHHSTPALKNHRALHLGPGWLSISDLTGRCRFFISYHIFMSLKCKIREKDHLLIFPSDMLVAWLMDLVNEKEPFPWLTWYDMTEMRWKHWRCVLDLVTKTVRNVLGLSNVVVIHYTLAHVAHCALLLWCHWRVMAELFSSGAFGFGKMSKRVRSLI